MSGRHLQAQRRRTSIPCQCVEIPDPQLAEFVSFWFLGRTACPQQPWITAVLLLKSPCTMSDLFHLPHNQGLMLP